MFVVYLGLGIILLIVIIYFGLELSKNIYHPVLKTFFWVIYLATMLTWGNIIAAILFYNVLRHKRGLPGVQGPIGEKGGRGSTGICDSGCKNKVCHIRITTELNQHYLEELRKIIKDFKGTPKIENREITEIIRKSCHSEAFEEISKVKTPDQIIVYMASIFKKWLSDILNMDSDSQKNKIRTYLETDGLEEVPLLGFRKTNPLNELEKYDVYHWGKDRIFHPHIIQYCGDPTVYGQMPQKNPPRLKAIRMNIYKHVYSHNYSTGHTPISFYRASPYNFKGTKYYPLGDMIGYEMDIKAGGRYVERYGLTKKNRQTVDFHGLRSYGPKESTVLVYGPAKYVRPPLHWELIWRNSKGSSITIWKPKDLYDHTYKKWFRGCGYLVMSNHGSNPRHQFGYNNPDRQPIRLIAEELLEDITKDGMKQLWSDRGSGSPLYGSIWMPKNPTYLGNQNNGIPVKGWNKPSQLKAYKLSDDTFISSDTKAVEFNNKMTDEKDLGMGYHGTPHRNPKYSVFTWLQMPLEVQLTNLGAGRKIFLTHSGLNKVNSYMIRKLRNGKNKLEGAFGVDPQNTYVGDGYKYNPQKAYQRWKIICLDQKGEIDTTCQNHVYLIKSVTRDLYLKIEIDKTGLGDPNFRISKLPNKDAPYYRELMDEYIWFNPKSATGNPLLMRKLGNKSSNAENLEKKWQENKK